MLSSFGSQGSLEEEPNMQINVKSEVGGAEQAGFQRPALVGGGRGVVDIGLQSAEQTSCGACSGLWLCPAIRVSSLGNYSYCSFQEAHCLLFTKVEPSR